MTWRQQASGEVATSAEEEQPRLLPPQPPGRSRTKALAGVGASSSGSSSQLASHPAQQALRKGGASSSGVGARSPAPLQDGVIGARSPSPLQGAPGHLARSGSSGKSLGDAPPLPVARNALLRDRSPAASPSSSRPGSATAASSAAAVPSSYRPGSTTLLQNHQLSAGRAAVPTAAVGRVAGPTAAAGGGGGAVGAAVRLEALIAEDLAMLQGRLDGLLRAMATSDASRWVGGRQGGQA